MSGYGSITDCSASGDLLATASSGAGYVGGFVGSLCNPGTPMISRCFATGNVSGGCDAIGGFAGYVTSQIVGNEIILNCYATGNVSGVTAGTRIIGGFVGTLTNAGTSNCYSLGTVTFLNVQKTDSGFVGSASSTNSSAIGCF